MQNYGAQRRKERENHSKGLILGPKETNSSKKEKKVNIFQQLKT